MEYKTQEINGILLSLDFIPVFNEAAKILGVKVEKYMKSSYLTSICDILKKDTHKIVANTDTKLNLTTIRACGKKLYESILQNKLQVYIRNIGERSEAEFGYANYYYRIYRARKNRLLKLSIMTKQYTLVALPNNKHEFNILKVIQWLNDWYSKTDLFIIDKKDMIKSLNAIIKYKDINKLFRIHFGDEYNEKDKKAFIGFVETMHKDLLNKECKNFDVITYCMVSDIFHNEMVLNIEDD